MTLSDELKPALGDAFSLMCSFAYAIDLIITETAVSREDVDAFQLGVYQLGFTGVWMLILAFVFEEPCLLYGGCLYRSGYCTEVHYGN